MMNAMFDSPSFQLLEQVAKFGERRHTVLLSNLANIDSPGYKTRDLPVDAFKKALENAVEKATSRSLRPHSLNSPISLHSPQRTSMNDLFPEELFQIQQAPAQNITFHDKNNRSIEHAMNEMQKNLMKYNYAVEMMRFQMSMLQTAISERL